MKTTKSVKKVAIIYDWADTNYGGAEKVLLALRELYPQATLVTAFVDWQKAQWVKQFLEIRTTFIQTLPKFIWRKKFLLTCLLPIAFESVDLSEFSLVISVSSFASKGVLTKPEQLHICYLLTPTRFLYSHRDRYLPSWQRWLLNYPLKYLKTWDQVAIWRPDQVIAISKSVAKRMQVYYGRTAETVIYPTMLDDKQIRQEKTSGFKNLADGYLLCVSRLVDYKRIDVVIEALKNNNYCLKIVGSGPQRQKLQRLVKQNGLTARVEFLGNLAEKDLKVYYNTALALIAPGLEDFGINLLEANQSQTWVVAHSDSGAMELLNEQQATGITQETAMAVNLALEQWQEKAQNCLLAKKQKYDKTDFKKSFYNFIEALESKK